MVTTQFKGNTVTTAGKLPTVGSQAPDFTLVSTDMSEISLSDYQGQWVLLNIFPSLDTGVCAASVREFNKRAAELDNTVVLNVSMDLPFAQARFCGAEGIDRAHTASAFRSNFGDDYGVRLEDSPMAGLLSRAVVVINPDGEVTYTQRVEEITTEPDYDDVVEHLGA
jgi:thiol peroxidase